MNRRKALGTIALGSAAVAFLPQCTNKEVLPVFEHFEVERKLYQLLSHLSQIILPKATLPIETMEPTSEYVLNVIDQCYAPSDRTRFLEGWQAYRDYLNLEVKKSVRRWDEAQVDSVLTNLEQRDAEMDSLAYFYQQTKALTKEHFTTSSYYMTNYLEYKFIPGGYEACVSV
ncbi:MAG: gluconate 2-dehydrogenase subunit 3 family protein [Bacteroidota bacterium]